MTRREIPSLEELEAESRAFYAKEAAEAELLNPNRIADEMDASHFLLQETVDLSFVPELDRQYQ